MIVATHHPNTFYMNPICNTDTISNLKIDRQNHPTNLIGNVQCIMILGQSDICLLFAVRSIELSVTREATTATVSPDECVNLGSLDIIQLLDGIFYLPLVRSDVNDEHKGVVLLNLLHRRLRVQGTN
jgi:hypothetical protein